MVNYYVPNKLDCACINILPKLAHIGRIMFNYGLLAKEEMIELSFNQQITLLTPVYDKIIAINIVVKEMQMG